MRTKTHEPPKQAVPAQAIATVEHGVTVKLEGGVFFGYASEQIGKTRYCNLYMFTIRNGSFTNFEVQKNVPTARIDHYLHEHGQYKSCTEVQHVVNGILDAIQEQYNVTF